MEKKLNITESMLESLRSTVVGQMSEKRAIHTLAVEKMAERLGCIYAPDKINLLRAAALLHDLTKEKKTQEQLELCEKYSITVTPDDLCAPKTFHAKTAAAVIKNDPQYAEYAYDDVVGAVRWHTTGRRGMSICEKIIYLSDYIDDSRKFSDCVELREYFWNGFYSDMTDTQKADHLANTLILSYDMTIRNLLEEGKPIAKDTFDARNELVCERLKANKTRG
jgi:nicotinate-nucleotide adenylyltransferase